MGFTEAEFLVSLLFYLRFHQEHQCRRKGLTVSDFRSLIPLCWLASGSNWVRKRHQSFLAGKQRCFSALSPSTSQMTQRSALCYKNCYRGLIDFTAKARSSDLTPGQ
jgi:hypothetical protein